MFSAMTCSKRICTALSKQDSNVSVSSTRYSSLITTIPCWTSSAKWFNVNNNFTKLNGLTAFEKSITDSFKDPKYKDHNASLIDQGKIGEVIISSIILLESEDLNKMQNGLIALIQAGLIDVARDIAIRLLVES